MSGYGSIQATLDRENYDIYAGALNEFKLYGRNIGLSQIGDEILSRQLPASSQLSRLQGETGKYMNLGLIQGQDYKQDWQAINTRSKISNEKGRHASSSLTPDRPPLITISNGIVQNKEYLDRTKYVLNHQKNFQWMPQRPDYKAIGA
jgi:hypothetical protein